MLSEIQKQISEILEYMWQCYGSPSKLMYGENVLDSAVGCQQGDPLGPAIFSLTINPIISNLNSKFNLWYLDDGSLGGNASSVLQDLDILIKKFSEIGLSLNFSKCQVYIPDSVPLNEKTILINSLNSLIPNISTISKKDLTLLGAPIFDDAFSSLLNSKLDNFNKFSHRLLDINPHMALYILRLCLFAPKFMYLLRCSPFWKYPSLISVLDVSLKDTLGKILNLQFDDRTWTQASLPVKYGGLGIRSISSIALPAFLSSASGSITLISQILNLTSPTDVVVESLAEAKLAWSASWPGKDYPIAVECQGLWDKPRVILTHADLVAQCTSATDKARILAVSEKESGHWLHALPSHSLGTILDQTALRVAVCLRLGIKVCEPHYCPCGSPVDRFGHHGLSCIRSAGRLYRHGAINDIVRRALATASVPAQLEPSGLFRDDGKRPDGMTIVPWSMGRALVWDATCVDTLAASHLSGTCQKAAAAAESAQELKRRKYSVISKDYVFAALAFETLGPWSSDTKAFINVVSQKLIHASGDPRAGAYFAQRLSLAVQRGNSASVLGTMPINDHLDGVYFL
ncbi:uncharacterized protein [Maniola hyperantus]|uniref:uncharacterized protein n=1 Tax=Aphantopus hyperantus TaxID=2795564 RepID=UPI003749CF09